MNSNNFADCELAWTSFNRPARVYKQVWAGMIKEGESGSRVHPTQKPVRITEDVIKDLELVVCFDGFLGSGTTLIACENLSRQCRAVELSPAYVAVALQRYKDAFGITPELIA
jgi:DNA modification methylase